MSISSGYIQGRKKWQRPQAMIWADAEPIISTDGKLIPAGYEVGSKISEGMTVTDEFLILSDHNRSSIGIGTERIENRQRMANGTMRSFHIADKLSINLSWSMIPSRGFKVYPDFDQSIGKPDIITEADKDELLPNTYFADKSEQYTADGGAGGGEMLDWYENHTGPFWVLLSYDKYNNFGTNDISRTKLSEYSQTLKMYISSFDYTVIKRGGNNFDLWDVSVTLEQV